MEILNKLNWEFGEDSRDGEGDKQISIVVHDEMENILHLLFCHVDTPQNNENCII